MWRLRSLQPLGTVPVAVPVPPVLGGRVWWTLCMTNRVLYLLGCAAPPLQYIDRPIRDAQAAGWDVCLGLTPTAADWLSDRVHELEDLTGHRVRCEKRRLNEVSPCRPGR
jgi:hypothetical protein